MSAPLDSVARLARLKITDPIATLEAIDKLLDRYDSETSASGTMVERLERLIKVGNAPLDGSTEPTGDCGCEHDDFECYAEQCLNASGLDVDDIDSIEALLDRFDPLPSSSGTVLERIERLFKRPCDCEHDDFDCPFAERLSDIRKIAEER